MQGAGGVGGMLSESSQITSNPITFNSSYPTYDGNGNVSEYLNSTGQVTAHYEYDPFGNAVVNTDTSNQFSYRFSTKPIAFATGLYYYGYRYYDPMTGRWPSRDPIEEKGGVSLYGFVGNDGINKNDKLGLAPSFWDQTIFGPGGGCAHEDKVETSWFEHNFAYDVEEWKQWARNTVTEAFSCSNRGRDIGSRDGYKYTLIPTRLPKREVYPWPQNRWSQIAQLGTAYLELVPSAIKWKIDAYPAPIGKGCCDTFSWSVTIQLRDGLGWDEGDGPVYYILGDGNPMFCGSGTRSPFPDRDIKRGEWKIYGTGACCDYKL
jgi:RHS repeat-associated protein